MRIEISDCMGCRMTFTEPSCWSASILFSFRNLFNLIEISFSKTLAKGDNNDIGL